MLLGSSLWGTGDSSGEGCGGSEATINPEGIVFHSIIYFFDVWNDG